MDMDVDMDTAFQCYLCGRAFPEPRSEPDKSALMDHLMTDHGILELAAFAFETMRLEQARNATSLRYARELDRIKREIVG